MWTWELSGNLNAWIPLWRTMSACSARTEWLFCQFPISFGILKINFITSIKWFRNLRFPTRVTPSKNNGFTGQRFFWHKISIFCVRGRTNPHKWLTGCSPPGSWAGVCELSGPGNPLSRRPSSPEPSHQPGACPWSCLWCRSWRSGPRLSGSLLSLAESSE